MLTSKQRAEFRAQANSLETALMVGKDGVTEAVVAEADKLLTARELVKGKVRNRTDERARGVRRHLRGHRRRRHFLRRFQVRHLAVQRKMSGRAQPDRPCQTQGDPQVQGRPGW